MPTMEATSPARLGKKRYHVGVIEGGPVWSIALGGVNFPVYTSKINALGQEIPSPGAYAWLDDAGREKVIDALKTKVVRWVKRTRTGEVIRADVYERTTMGFVPEPDDEPLAKYVYMTEAPETPVMNVAQSVLAAMEGEKKAAEKSEAAKESDPRDQKTRELHGKLKKTGGSVPSEGEL